MRFALLLPLALLAGGCVAKPSAPHAMAGEWRVAEIDDDAPANPAEARLTFEADRLSASVGCNGMGGPWQVEQNRLIAGPLASTEMYCVGPVGEQEKALAALLVAAPTIALDDGELILRSSRHSVRLERVSPPQRDS